MNVSTKSEYGLRALIYLAGKSSHEATPAPDKPDVSLEGVLGAWTSIRDTLSSRALLPEATHTLQTHLSAACRSAAKLATDPELNKSGGGAFTIMCEEQKLDMSSLMTMMSSRAEYGSVTRSRYFWISPNSSATLRYSATVFFT